MLKIRRNKLGQGNFLLPAPRAGHKGRGDGEESDVPPTSESVFTSHPGCRSQAPEVRGGLETPKGHCREPQGGSHCWAVSGQLHRRGCHGQKSAPVELKPPKYTN